MRDRIIEFLGSENKTSAQFAEEIGVQPSGVSHIISGRNNPSLDFVLKMLTRYSFLSPEWLLFGKEPMYTATANPTLFDINPGPSIYTDTNTKGTIGDEQVPDYELHIDSDRKDIIDMPASSTENRDSRKKPVRIVFFYSDRSFEEYEPGL